jgi:hypothetical protein
MLWSVRRWRFKARWTGWRIESGRLAGAGTCRDGPTFRDRLHAVARPASYAHRWHGGLTGLGQGAGARWRHRQWSARSSVAAWSHPCMRGPCPARRDFSAIRLAMQRGFFRGPVGLRRMTSRYSGSSSWRTPASASGNGERGLGPGVSGNAAAPRRAWAMNHEIDARCEAFGMVRGCAGCLCGGRR